MRKTILLLLALTAAALCPAQHVYDVRDFGAKGNGVHIDSHAINAAIEQAALEGGGMVRVPEGVYPCYSIRLKSNITLQLDSGAIVKAAMPTAEESYDLPEENLSRYQDFGHSHWKNSLIWGIGLRNIAITGKGRIDGSGVLSRGRPTLNGLPVANKAVALRECRQVRLADIEMLNCGHFALLLTGVDSLMIEGLTVDTNRDGLDIDCCEDVIIRDCRVNTLNDDAIVLKTSYGLNRLKPTANVIIENCHVTGYDVGTLMDGTLTTLQTKAPDQDGPTGRIKLGTESNGDFRNIIIRNCSFTHCRGLALETVSRLSVPDVRFHVVGTGSEKEVAQYKSLAKNLHLEGTVIWHGQVSRDEVQRMMARETDLFFFTSVYEATSSVVLEAISNHLPVVCFDACGFGPIIDDTVGRKVPLTDPERSVRDFAAVIESLYADPDLRRRLSEQCAEKVKQLSWEWKMARLMQMYDA